MGLVKSQEANSVNIYRNLGDNKGETPLRKERFQRTWKGMTMMKPKRKPKTFAGTVAQNLTRKKQVETMRKQLLKSAHSNDQNRKAGT